MSNRERARQAFLDGTPWETWEQWPIAQDASTRSYLRLTHGSESVIVMDANPEDGQDVEPFIYIAEELLTMGLAPPRIFQKDTRNGFLILEDLGTTDVSRYLVTSPNEEEALYQTATDLLLHIAKQPPPELSVMTPKRAGEMVRITAEHYVQSPTLADDLTENVTSMIAAHCSKQNTLALRDYHAENLIWRPRATGLKRIGLLDFQDAFIAPIGYDLASLLRDARRDVDPQVQAAMVKRFADGMQQDEGSMALAIASLAVQRNLRILGVFARLIRIAGKRRYASMLLRVWQHIRDDLEHPELKDLQSIFAKGIPDPRSPQIASWCN